MKKTASRLIRAMMSQTSITTRLMATKTMNEFCQIFFDTTTTFRLLFKKAMTKFRHNKSQETTIEIQIVPFPFARNTTHGINL